MFPAVHEQLQIEEAYQHPAPPVVPPQVRYDWALLAPTPNPFSKGTWRFKDINQPNRFIKCTPPPKQLGLRSIGRTVFRVQQPGRLMR